MFDMDLGSWHTWPLPEEGWKTLSDLFGGRGCWDSGEGQNMVGYIGFHQKNMHDCYFKDYVILFDIYWNPSLSLYMFSSCVYIHKSLYTSWICRWSGIATNLREEFLSRPEITYAMDSGSELRDDLIELCIWGFPKIGGNPPTKWMVYNGRPY